MLVKSASTALFVSLVAAKSCRTFPGDPEWPQDELWTALNDSVDSRLIKTVPIGSPCHDPTYDEEKCNAVRENWHTPEFHLPSASSVMNFDFLNKSCDPFDPRETLCNVGAYVQYAVNVSEPHHVVQALEFVKKHDIRFVVKNTGHDYLGRSTGAGALSVWTHHLQNIDFMPEYNGSYTGPAFKVQAGVHGINVVQAANKEGLAIVGGECQTVGLAGGYIQGGGHSILSPLYGLAADQTLEFEVITTEGKFIRASPDENEDLYWALSGGGGGTYGIVWSVTIKAYKDLPMAVASVNFNSSDISQDTFWKALDAYQAFTPALTDANIFAMVQYTNTSLRLGPIFAPNKTAAEVLSLLRPFQDTLDHLKIDYTSKAASYGSYLEGYNSAGFEWPVGDTYMGGRLLPRSLWQDKKTLGALQKSIRGILENGAKAFDFVIRPGAGNPHNAVLPAWRDAERHFLTLTPFVDGGSLEDVAEAQRKITNEWIPELKKLTPGGGSYVNEADHNDPDFKDAFYGANYDKLLAIKDEWDPAQVLYGKISVGGDRWYERDDGRLCRSI